MRMEIGKGHKLTALIRVEKYYRQEAFLSDYRAIYDEAKRFDWATLKRRIFPYYLPKPVPYVKVMLKHFKVVSWRV
ncbi:MAG: hypothetical protein Q9M40_02185 [Sulfurimonas sp.]|nr:hypothetical protein [Sulfurimonas sp.]